MHTPDRDRIFGGADDAVRAQLSAAAQTQLASLRATFDERVDALERALLDPSRASSLVPLVLDLTRVATEEAEAVARQACLQTQLDAQSAALAAVVNDRTTIAELRRVNEHARQEIDRLMVEIGQERERTNLAQQAMAHVDQRVMEAETRAADAEARATEHEERLGEAEDRIEALEAERGELLGVQTQLNAQLEKAKSALGSAKAQNEALQGQLADLHHGFERKAAEYEATARRLETAAREADARAQAATADRDARAKEFADQFAAVQGALSSERVTFDEQRGRFEATLRESEGRTATACRDRDEAASRLAALQQTMSDRETQWTQRLQAIESKWKALTVAPPAPAPVVAVAPPVPAVPKPPSARPPVVTAAPVAPAPAAAPTPVAVAAPAVVTGSPAVTAAAAAPAPARVPASTPAGAKAAKNPASATPTPPARPAAPKPPSAPPPVAVVPAPVVVPQREPQTQNAEASAAPVDNGMDHIPANDPPPLPAAKLFDAQVSDAGEGVFSTVADALRAWTTEGDAHPQPAGASPEPPRAEPEPAPSAGPTVAKPVASTAYDTMRQTPRHDFSERRLTIQVDGSEALVIDLSKGGAQVLTPAMLKPGRQVKVVFPTKGAGAHGKAKIAWSKLEPPSSGSGVLQYRAGLTFTTFDHKVIERLLQE